MSVRQVERPVARERPRRMAAPPDRLGRLQALDRTSGPAQAELEEPERLGREGLDGRLAELLAELDRLGRMAPARADVPAARLDRREPRQRMHRLPDAPARASHLERLDGTRPRRPPIAELEVKLRQLAERRGDVALAARRGVRGWERRRHGPRMLHPKQGSAQTPREPLLTPLGVRTLHPGVGNSSRAAVFSMQNAC